MKRLLPFLVLLSACGGAPDAPAPPADAVAFWDGGAVGLAEIESRLGGATTPACAERRRAAGGGTVDELIPCYREIAELAAWEDLVLRGSGADLEQALAEVDLSRDVLHRRILSELFMRRLNEEIEVADDEVAARFEAERERFERPAGLTLWNLFLRHEDPDHPEKTDEALRRLRDRFLAGETFDSLARAHSQSETRRRGGLVGRIVEGRLPPRLERIAFALEDGGISEPVLVSGGAVLLHVRNATPGAEPDLERARETVRREMVVERLDAAIAERVADRRPPADALVLGFDELLDALDRADPELVVLEIDGEALHAAEFRRQAGLGERSSVELGDEERAEFEALYRRLVERRLLGHVLLETASPELREEAEGRLQETAVARLADEHLRRAAEESVDRDEARLRRYYEDNPHHYQSPLSYRLRVWTLPFDADPPAQLLRMEELRDALSRGEIDLEAASTRLGGAVKELGWRPSEELGGDLPPKARAWIAEMAGDGFSVPYQQDQALHVVEVAERREPLPLDYESARNRVREDYLARFAQDLARRVLDERLAAADFTFNENALRRLLAPQGVDPDL